MINKNQEKDLKDIINDRLSDLIEEKLKKNSELSQDLQAKEIGISAASLSKYANGITIPNASSLKKMAKYYNVSADFLLGLSDSKAPNVNDRNFADELGLSDMSIKTLKYKFDIFGGLENMVNDFFGTKSNPTTINDIIDFLLNNCQIISFLAKYWHSDFGYDEEIMLDEARSLVSRRSYEQALKENKHILSYKEIKGLEDKEVNDFIAFARLEKTIKKDKEKYLKWIGDKYGKYKKN